MAMAARSPAAPPPTISTSCAARTTPSLTPPLLVGEHLPVVVHDEAVAAAVVELLPAAAAAAGVAHVLGDEALVVLRHVLLTPVPVTARSEAGLEDGSGGTHGPSPSTQGQEPPACAAQRAPERAGWEGQLPPTPDPARDRARPGSRCAARSAASGPPSRPRRAAATPRRR